MGKAQKPSPFKKQETMEEIWKKVKGFEGRYEVSNKGQVRSLNRVGSCGPHIRPYKGKILSAGIKENGYLQVMLGRSQNKYVHRLVAEAFLPNPNNYPEIDHIDCNRQNNDVTNLRWVNRSMNNLNPITSVKRRISVLQIDMRSGEIIKEWSRISEARKVIHSHLRNLSKNYLKAYRGYYWKLK